MDMSMLIQISAIPAALVVFAGLLVLRLGRAETAGRRFLLFLLGICVALLLAVFISSRLPAQDNRLGFTVSNLLAGAILGVLVLILINLRRLREMPPVERVLAAALAAALLPLLVIVIGSPYGMASILLPTGLILILAWSLRRSPLLAVIAALALLDLLFYDGITSLILRLPGPAASLLAVLHFALPGLLVALGGILIASSLERNEVVEGDKLKDARVYRLPRPLSFALGIVLLAVLCYKIYWFSIWDQTSDGLAGLFFSSEAALVAIAAGMVIAVTRTGRAWFAGLVFAASVPILVFAAFRQGWDASYHEITERRAARLQRALEQFQDRQGRYPQSLSELVPRDLLAIPGPVILKGEDWCYQGGVDSYRLGAFYREYFSLPLSLREYASAGDLQDEGWECAQRLAEMKARYDPNFSAEGERILPTPAPQPTSQIPIERTVVSPLVEDSSIIPGTFSPDGRFWLFNRAGSSGDQRAATLHFLNTATGEICSTEVNAPAGSDLRRQTAWLTDGRLLFLSGGGELAVLQPCRPGVEWITGRYPAQFTEAVTGDPESGRILLKGPDSYWILDGNNLEGRPVQGVSPNPYEAHWDQYAWTPGGERLAISRLNGREAKEGSTLYLVAGDSGEVLTSLELEEASEQSAPMIQWLSRDELLLHGQGELKVYDFTIVPPGVTDVMKDRFSLDLAYPNEISAMDALANPASGDYHLILRANHPRNQAIYMYHSETGQSEILHPEGDALLFFPSGEWTEMTKVEYAPAEGDEYELYWIDAGPREPARLAVQGHLPREDPRLWVRYLPDASQLVFSSQQGVSLVSLPDGRLLRFWELSGGSGLSPAILVAPDERSLIVAAEGEGLYWIPLEEP
jgi:hypothetical protein